MDNVITLCIHIGIYYMSLSIMQGVMWLCVCVRTTGRNHRFTGSHKIFEKSENDTEIILEQEIILKRLRNHILHLAAKKRRANNLYK